MVWSGDLLLKLKRSASFAKVAAEPPIGRYALLEAHQAYAHGLFDNKPSRTITTLQVTQRLLTAVIATRAAASILESEM